MDEMNETTNNGDANRDDVAPLIRLAGARERVDTRRLAEAHTRVSNHWQSVVRDRARQRNRRRVRVFAMAASVVAAVALGLVLLQPAGVETASTVAQVNRVIGDVFVDGRRVERGEAIAADAVIGTASGGRLVLALAGGQVMRVDTDSELAALGSSRFRLTAGAVYIDSADSAPSASVYIETPFGVASDVGTQFQVRVSDERLLLGVREGLVALKRDDEPQVSVTVGRVFELSLIDGSIERDTGPDDPIWQWVNDTTPDFDIDGETLYAYLNWYARQQGLTLEWRDRASEARAASTRLSGSIEGLTLEEGLETVARIAPFSFEQSDRVLAVRVE